MRRRRLLSVVALVAAAVAGSVTTVAIWGRSTSSTPTKPRPVATARIVRTNLATSVLTEGTLGYEPTNPIVNQVGGTYTALPAPGTTIQPGQALYRVDNQPVVLMAGSIPAWRAFSVGMADGPDVSELEANLVALGFAKGLLSTTSDQFTSLTADAVSRWQIANGYPSTGQVALGEIVFESGPVLVGAGAAAPGQPASPGDQPFQATTTTRIVSVPLGPNLPPVSVGEAVAIVLASGATTPGRVAAVEPVAASTSGSGGQGSSSGVSSSSTSSQSGATTVATVTPEDPAATGVGSGAAVQVSIVSRAAANVLAVPIAALLALAGGGYGLEVITPSGQSQLVGVTTGIFTGSQVQVSGRGIDAGLKVAVAQ